MYRQDPQLQSAIKAAAAARVEMYDRLDQTGGVNPAYGLTDMPLMEAEYSRLSQSIAELGVSVLDLIARIAPVCQPGALGCGETKDANGQNIEVTPSDLRAKLMGLRGTVESISRQIAEVKFRIEI